MGRIIKSTIPILDKNSVSLAGEFAVLSQLSLRGYDANMTLGRTKSVDILVSNPHTGRMLKLEVKTNYRSTRASGTNSNIFGRFLSGWMMDEKHEVIRGPNLFYCFVNISEDTKHFRFFIMPSVVVANYVKVEHVHWLNFDKKQRRENPMRWLRIGMENEKYPIPTPLAEKYEDNWEFKK